MKYFCATVSRLEQVSPYDYNSAKITRVFLATTTMLEVLDWAQREINKYGDGSISVDINSIEFSQLFE